jgi:hypothetical protein
MAMSAGGTQTLADLVAAAQSESDCVNDPHITTTEWNTWINNGYFRLYNLLIQKFGDDYFTSQATITTDGVNNLFALPSDFYKGLLVECISGMGVAAGFPVTMRPFMLREKNRYMFPNALVVAPFFPRYRLQGSSILFAPTPSNGLVINIWYAPKLGPLANPTDSATDLSGYLDMVVLNAAIKALLKQERDASSQMLRLRELMAEIDAAAANRNVGEPNTVVITEGEGFGPWGGGPFGTFGGNG